MNDLKGLFEILGGERAAASELRPAARQRGSTPSALERVLDPIREPVGELRSLQWFARSFDLAAAGLIRILVGSLREHRA